MVRLVDGNFVNEGYVEVYCNGQWGTVTNTSFDLVDGNVFCQQLGYTNVMFFGSRNRYILCS